MNLDCKGFLTDLKAVLPFRVFLVGKKRKGFSVKLVYVYGPVQKQAASISLLGIIATGNVKDRALQGDILAKQSLDGRLETDKNSKGEEDAVQNSYFALLTTDCSFDEANVENVRLATAARPSRAVKSVETGTCRLEGLLERCVLLTTV